jgi:hypothetical protein
MPLVEDRPIQIGRLHATVQVPHRPKQVLSMTAYLDDRRGG